MATRDEPLDPQEVLAAAEAAHLAARRTVPISRDQTDRPTVPISRDQTDRPTVPISRDQTDRPDPEGGTRAGGERETKRHWLDRPGRTLPRRPPLPLAAGVAALWAALVTFTPVALLVTLLPLAEGGATPVGGPVRVAAAGWLLAHGVPLQTGAGPVSLIPLALTALAAWRVARAGVHVVRARGARGTGSLRQALLAAAAVAVAYGSLGVLMAAVAGGPGWGPQVPRAGLTVTGFGLLAASYGSLRATGALATLARRTPAVLRDGGRAGLLAAAGMVAAGAATVGTALAIGGGAAAELVAAYGTGVAGQAGLTLLCLAYAPNLAGWAAAYLVGPGFAVGVDTVIRSSEVAVGPLPVLPVVAALPTGPLPTLGAALLAAPVVAGAAAGWLLASGGETGERTRGDPPAWTRLVPGALLAGLVAGVLLGFAAAAAGGSLGGGQLATIGPEPVLVAVATAATVAPGALLGAGAARLWRR